MADSKRAHLLRMASRAAARSAAGTSRWYSSGATPAAARLAATSLAAATLAANTSVRPTACSSPPRTASCGCHLRTSGHFNPAPLLLP